MPESGSQRESKNQYIPFKDHGGDSGGFADDTAYCVYTATAVHEMQQKGKSRVVRHSRLHQSVSLELCGP